MITRSSLFGKSTNLICFTATVSPVFQFRALEPDPKAPLPTQSPNCYIKSPLATPITGTRESRNPYIILKLRDILSRRFDNPIILRFVLFGRAGVESRQSRFGWSTGGLGRWRRPLTGFAGPGNHGRAAGGSRSPFRCLFKLTLSSWMHSGSDNCRLRRRGKV